MRRASHPMRRAHKLAWFYSKLASFAQHVLLLLNISSLNANKLSELWKNDLYTRAFDFSLIKPTFVMFTFDVAFSTLFLGALLHFCL